MPALKAPAKVLVSGANGFVAIWLVRTLLEHGYSVRGTVRSPSKGTHLTEIFKSYGDKFELAIVPDITADGAFDEAVKGVDAIEHTASPFILTDINDPKEIIEPAVKGTLSILKSALSYGSTVKRAVVLSSVVSVFYSPTTTERTFTEEDWHDQALQEVEELGPKSSTSAKYSASKTLAEKAAWDFWKENKDKVNWDLVTLNPPFVFGPVIHEVSSPDRLNTSAKMLYDVIGRPDAGGQSNEELAAPQGSWIDVRDITKALTLSLEKEAASGQRIIISAGNYTFQDFIDAANTVSSSRKLPKGNPGGGTKNHLVHYSSEKEEKTFGIKKRSFADTAKDILADYDAKGW